MFPIPKTSPSGVSFLALCLPEVTTDENIDAAGYHSSFRDVFIEMDKAENVDYRKFEQNHPNGLLLTKTVHEPDHGEAVNDITSHCTNHSTWTPDLDTIQNTQHERLFQMRQPEGFKQEETEFWYHYDQQGRKLIIIDHDKNPMKWYRNTPRAISSKAEGWRMEGMRRQNGMSYIE